ncbi:ArsR/SmtB family transcription factor [Haloarcula pelagica]|uniref:ArsR/SmtB family transcription factor n=1 Tax=Haloarcula pelagica TaxID=3033389 RepID=UPI0024C24DA5|nr:winged helix-turn-helix domain-containing protein [Halomicroarcula sp. YJ-61-S]
MSATHTTTTEDSAGETDTLPSGEILTRLNAAYAQQILETISTEAKPARDIAVECGASRATVYRRLNSLQEAGLVETEMQYDGDGHHRTVFKTNFESLALEMTVDGLTVTFDGAGTGHSSIGARPSASGD